MIRGAREEEDHGRRSRGGDSYRGVVGDPTASRRWPDEGFRAEPELSPPGFGLGYGLKDGRTSARLGGPSGISRPIGPTEGMLRGRRPPR